jgi:hypothetical protein
MVTYMKEVAKIGGELTVDERNLLSVAYKNVVGTRRASWRIISSIEQKEESKGSEKHVPTIKEYRTKIEKELEDVCEDVLNVLDQHLIPHAESGESKVFYYKMYVAEAHYDNFSIYRKDEMQIWVYADPSAGRATTIATLPSSPLERSARRQRQLLMTRTRYA